MNDKNDYEVSIGELKKHLNNLFNALIAVCPTRNYISQFLMALPEEYAVMYDSFPEFLMDKEFRSQFRTALGLEIGPKIQYLSDSFTEKLIKIIEITFEIFNNDTWVQIWNDLLGDIRSDKILNLLKEWVLAKIQLAIKDPVHGKNTFTILKQIYENQLYNQEWSGIGYENRTTFKRGIKLEDIIIKLQISEVELETTINFLTDKLKIIQKVKQKQEGEVEHDVVLLADSIKLEWLSDLFQTNNP